MKKTLLLAGIISAKIANAQSITVDDTLSTGDVMHYYAADTSALVYDNITGPGATWDYSNLSYADIGGLKKDSVIEISTSSYASNYPSADYHENFEDGVQTFFTNTEDSIVTHGFVFITGAANEYIIRYNVDPLTSVKFPMTVGSSYTDLIDGDAVVPVSGTPTTVSLSGDATISADGSGTLNLGANTYSDIIRVKTVENLTGTVILVGNVSVTRTSYMYYSPSTSDMPVFIHGGIIADLGNLGSVSLKTVWSKDMLNGYAGIEEDENNQSLSLYPNPASDEITITSENAESLVILNTAGQEIKTIVTPNKSEKIDVSELPQGVYIVKIKNSNHTTTQKFVIK